MIDFVSAEGPAGIYRGLVPTIFKSASNQALRFGIFGEYKRVVWCAHTHTHARKQAGTAAGPERRESKAANRLSPNPWCQPRTTI